MGSIKHPGDGNVWCFLADNTRVKSIEVISGSVQDRKVTVPAAPPIKAAPEPDNLPKDGTNDTDCYYIPPIADNEDLVGNLLITTDPSNDPTDYLISYYLFDVDLDVDADTLEIINDIQDEDKNDLGYSTEDWVKSDSRYGIS